MEQLIGKLDLYIKCPYCNKGSDYVMHIDTTDVICNSCDKSFDIELWVDDIEVKALKINIKYLRSITGDSMYNCKKALEQLDWCVDDALKALKIKCCNLDKAIEEVKNEH